MSTSYFRPTADNIEKFSTIQHRPFGQAYYDTDDYQLAKKGWWLRVHYWNDRKDSHKQWSLWINDKVVSEDNEDIERRLDNANFPPLPYTGESKRLMKVISFVDGHQIDLGNGVLLNAISWNGRHLLIGETSHPNIISSALPPIVEIFTRRREASRIVHSTEQELYDLLTKRYNMSLRAPEVDIPGITDATSDVESD